jgi:hypothetical protein
MTISTKSKTSSVKLDAHVSEKLSQLAILKKRTPHYLMREAISLLMSSTLGLMILKKTITLLFQNATGSYLCFRAGQHQAITSLSTSKARAVSLKLVDSELPIEPLATAISLVFFDVYRPTMLDQNNG